jgi:dienelactone hydrolase
VEFCRKLSEKEGVEYRLPTEAEWEYACRAGTTTAYVFGDNWAGAPGSQGKGALDSYGWFGINADQKGEAYPHRVGQKAANAWGLYDMHGNVAEWCSDWWGEDYYKSSPVLDPRGPEAGRARIQRGGSWKSFATFCGSAARDANPPGLRDGNVGFRVVAVDSTRRQDQRSSTEREVSFAGAEGVKLAGTLLIPDHQTGEKLPGAIIVHGSGPSDRNGNAAGVTTDFYKQIAHALAQEGIGSLRYDKRSIGASAGPREGESLVEFVKWENFLGDAVAALAFLQDQPEIDPNRTAMIGHSEGGMLNLQAAGEGKGFRRPPAALVLAGTPGRQGEVVLRQQIARNPFNALLLSKENDRIMAAILETGRIPDDVPPLLAHVYPPHLGKYWQSVLKFEGAAWASRVPCPVLVIAGEKDLNHVVALETAALSDALKTRRTDDHEVYIVPSASHMLKPVKNAMDPGFVGEMAPEAAAKLRSWLRTHLSASP